MSWTRTDVMVPSGTGPRSLGLWGKRITDRNLEPTSHERSFLDADIMGRALLKGRGSATGDRPRFSLGSNGPTTQRNKSLRTGSMPPSPTPQRGPTANAQ